MEKNFYEFVKNVLVAEIDTSKNEVLTSMDLAFDMLYTYHVDGTYTYDKKESEKIIRMYYHDICDIYEKYHDVDEYVYENAFTNPEKYLVELMIYYGQKIMEKLPFVKPYVNTYKEIHMDDENIEIMTKELLKEGFTNES